MAARNKNSKKQTAQGAEQKQSPKGQKGKSKGAPRSPKDGKTNASSMSWKKKVTGWHIAVAIIGE